MLAAPHDRNCLGHDGSEEGQGVLIMLVQVCNRSFHIILANCVGVVFPLQFLGFALLLLIECYDLITWMTAMHDNCN